MGWAGEESKIPLQGAVAEETAGWESRNLCAGQYVKFRQLMILTSTFLSWTSALRRLRSAALLCPVNRWIQDVSLRCPPWDYKHTKLHGFLITKRRESWNTALIYEILSTEQNGSEQSGSEISMINLFVHWKKKKKPTELFIRRNFLHQCDFSLSQSLLTPTVHEAWDGSWWGGAAFKFDCNMEAPWFSDLISNMRGSGAGRWRLCHTIKKISFSHIHSSLYFTVSLGR